MPKNEYVKGQTDVTVNVLIQDSSSSTGAGLTGLVYNSAGLTCTYSRLKSAAASIPLVTQTVTGAHTDGGFVEISSSLQPGMYRLDLPDAVCAAGSNSVTIMLHGATNMAPCALEIQLPARDPNTALNDISASDVLTQATSALNSYDPPTRAELTSDLSSLLTSIQADVTASWVTDTLSELSQAQPPSTPTPAQALMFLYMALRNLRDTTATRDKIYNDAGVCIAQAVLSDDGVTTKREKFISGS